MMGWLVKGLGLGFNPGHVALAAAAVFVAGLAVGTGAGWTVRDWKAEGSEQRAAGEIRALNLVNATLEAANGRCAVNVADVKAGVQSVLDDAHKVNAKALDNMARTAGEVAGHMAKAAEALGRPPVPPDQWCQALQKEMGEYRARRQK